MQGHTLLRKDLPDKMIKFKSVYLTRKDKKIFSNLDLTIRENEKVLIRGKSGIGKTTFFKILLGFEKIDKGLVRFNGFRIDKSHIKEIRAQIFYLSQDIDLMNKKVGCLVDEILAANYKKGLSIHGLDPYFSLLDLDDTILDQEVKDLSGGERQRIGLLICFLLDRPVWLMDEPTSALDGPLKKKVANYILDQRKTIVIISHDDIWKKYNAVKIERWS